MMMASTEGALAFQKGLGAVHALAHPLGALDGLPLHHGTLNAVLLPAVLRFTAPAAAGKHARLREVAGLAPDADLGDAVAALNRTLGLPRGLAELGVDAAVLPRIARAAVEDPASATNARPVTLADYEALLAASF
jgi:alcohol dehydrogenase class IV